MIIHRQNHVGGVIARKEKCVLISLSAIVVAKFCPPFQSWTGQSLFWSAGLWSAICLVSSSQDPELHSAMVTVAKTVSGPHILDQFLLVCKNDVQQSVSSRQLLDPLCQEAILHALQTRPALLVPCCVVPLVKIRVVQVLLPWKPEKRRVNNNPKEQSTLLPPLPHHQHAKQSTLLEIKYS